ncbi:U3 small nucleolar RNA-associated protein 13 [Tulasnella sp. 424]|nr:U3 small nucleolar RNA-associated protein 13 [Tulasnella sp. 424]KAG8977343.1 U3 small nucleolar RNA-associated protein 13 [Tulasnella sp. 425]
MNASHAPRKLRTTFRKTKVISPLHTSGPFAVSSDCRRLVTCVDDEVVLTDVDSASEICRFKGDTTPATALAITPSNTHLIVVYTSLVLRIYELPLPSSSPEPPTSSETPHIPWVRQIPRAHDGPVHVLAVDPTSSYLASGSADGHVKVWDIHRGYVTHHYGGQGGVVSALAFDFQKASTATSASTKKKSDKADATAAWKSMRLITGSVDSRVRIFDLKLQRTDPVAILEGHTSVPRSISVSSDGKWLVTAGRDSVILIWDLHSAFSAQSAATTTTTTKKGTRVDVKLVKTVPVLERVEAAGILSAADCGDEKGLRVFTAGEKGVVRVWDVNSGKVTLTLEGHTVGADSSEAVEEQGQIIHAIYLPQTSTIASLHADQTILFHSLKAHALTRQFIGYNDQIIDATFLSPFSSPTTAAAASDSPSSSSHLALATNSSLIRMYDTTTLDARLLSGHTDMVLCLDKGAAGMVLASGSKDKSARIWAPSSVGADAGEEGEVSWHCVAICEGHTESVGAVAFSRRQDQSSPSLRFMITGSQDRTIKLWDVQSVPTSSSSQQEQPPLRLKSLSTQVAHEKDINSLDVSPNDQLLATASQDKTAKIYNIEYSLKPGKGNAKGDLKLVATLKGHKRGVWNVKFSKFDRVVATASGDKSVKLWSLESFACLKTFEGHTNSVLRVDFLNKGLQLVTSAADGLVKLWNVKDEECTATLDNHEEKVWALAIPSHEKYIVSAAADSVVTFWEDCTELEEEEKLAEKAELVLKEQDFLNYVELQDYRNAILLALSMDQPRRLFNLFQAIRPNRTTTSDDPQNPPSVTGNVSVDEVIRTLPPLELGRLLKHVRNWNANTKTFAVAQTTLHAILKLRPASDILKTFDASEPNEALMEIADGALAGGPRDKDMRALKELLDGLIPYTERHLNRAEKLIQDSYVVDYILSEMDLGILVPAENDAMEIS